MATVTRVIAADAEETARHSRQMLDALAGKRLLITGAGGFLCSFLLDVVAAYNADAAEQISILAIDNFRTGLPERIQHLKDRAEFTFVTHDVATEFRCDNKVDWIIHGAGIGSPTFYRRFPLETIDANVAGTRWMLECARQHSVEGYLQLSSSEIYGDPDPSHIPTSEDYAGSVSCIGPRACYDESKRLGETLAMVYYGLHGVPVKIVRPFNVYGPGQRLDDARIIPDLLSAALSGRPIVLFSDGRATRSFCYVSDFVAGLLYVLVSGKPGEAYNVGNDEEISIAHAAELMCRLDGRPVGSVEYRVSADLHYLTDNPQRRCPDVNKVFAATGWRAMIPLAEGLSRTLRSYREESTTAL